MFFVSCFVTVLFCMGKQCLGLVQSTLKLQLMGETFSEQTCDDQHFDLCRCLYKLHFQALLFIENYAKLVSALHKIAASHEVCFFFLLSYRQYILFFT